MIELTNRVREVSVNVAPSPTPTPTPPTPTPAVSNTDNHGLARAVKNILGTQDEVWGLLRENSRLIEQFTGLAAASSPLDNTDHIIQQINLLALGTMDTGHPTDL